MALETGIYSITNIANGRRYIGSALLFSKRFREHRVGLRSGKHYNSLLQRAWTKYGEASFAFEKLIVCEKTNLVFYEQRAINGYMSANREHGYNLSPTAGSPLGLKRSAQTRALQSALKKGKPSFNKGKKMPPGWGEAARAALRGKPAWNRGLPFSEESRKKMSENHKVHGKEGSFQRNLTHCMRGHLLSPENIYVAPKKPGSRACKICLRMAWLRAAEKRRAL